MLKKKILNYILNVNHTVVDEVKIFDDDSIVFYVHPTKSETCRCGKCGRKCKFFDAYKGTVNEPEHRIWRGLDIGTHKAYICSEVYRVDCPEDGPTVCAFPWARHGSRFTTDFENTVAWLSLNCGASPK